MKKRRKTARSKARRLHPWIRLSIWSLHRHDHLIAGLRMVMWSSAALVLLAVFAGRLDLETALRLIAFGGLSAVVLLTGSAGICLALSAAPATCSWASTTLS